MDISGLTGQALRDAKWVLSFDGGALWQTGGFRPNRERQLVEAGVLIPVPGKEGLFTVYQQPAQDAADDEVR